MNQRVSSLTIGAAIIVAGLVVAAAIVFGPTLLDRWRLNGSKKAEDDSAASKSDLAPGQRKAEASDPAPVQRKAEPPAQPKTVDLVVIAGEIIPVESVKGWFFIDGTYRRKLSAHQFVSDSYQVRPGSHELCWIFYEEGCTWCIATSISVQAGMSTSYELPRSARDFLQYAALQNEKEKMKDGLRMHYRSRIDIRAKAASESHEVWCSWLVNGVKEFNDYDLWKTLSNTSSKESFNQRCWFTFPESLGGKRQVDIEELQILRGMTLRSFDVMIGTDVDMSLWSLKQDAYLTELRTNVRVLRKTVEDRLDGMIKAESDSLR